MKQIIAKNRAEAKKFCEGGSIHTQRAAYWKQGSIAYRFERLPGETSPTWREDVGGYWWSATQTINQKLGIGPVSAAAAAMGRKGGAAKSDRKTAAVKENGRKGGRPRNVQLVAADVVEDFRP